MFVKGNSGCLQVPHRFWTLQRLCLAVLYNNCQRGKASKTEPILLKKNPWDQGAVSLYEAPTQQDLKAFQICKYWWTQQSHLMRWWWSHKNAFTEACYIQRRTYHYVTWGSKEQQPFRFMGRGAPQEMFYKGGQRGSWGWPPLFMGTINNDSEKRKTPRSAPLSKR